LYFVKKDKMKQQQTQIKQLFEGLIRIVPVQSEQNTPSVDIPPEVQQSPNWKRSKQVIFFHIILTKDH
jgi:hypothetical protein